MRGQGNVDEATRIIEWLTEGAGLIMVYAQKRDSKLNSVIDEEVFLKSVEVVTPFSKQENLIRSIAKRSRATSVYCRDGAQL